jgi:hypothetical protein
LLHHYELSQRSAGYEILNTTEHERQEKCDWFCTGNTMEELAYMDKMKRVPTCFQMRVMDSVPEFNCGSCMFRIILRKKNLRGFGPLANYADRETAASWRSSTNFCG